MQVLTYLGRPPIVSLGPAFSTHTDKAHQASIRQKNRDRLKPIKRWKNLAENG